MNIILFSTADWDNPFWTNKQHMAKIFEQNGHKVIYIDSLGIRKPTPTAKDLKRVFKRVLSFIKPYKKVSHSIWVIKPPIIPIHNSSTIQKLNDTILFAIIKVLMLALKIKEYTIWTYSPVTDSILDKFNATNIVYHCVDDLSSLPNVDKKTIKQREDNLIKKSDYIFTTSKNLYDTTISKNKNTYYFNNVCDYEHFSKAKTKTYTLPDDLKHIPKNKIIFIGAISSYKVNFPLLKRIASNNPSWHIIMIGKVGEGEPQTNISSLKESKNIHFLGAKDYSELPRYLHFGDATIIPANINDYTKSMFPMKFFEYLSAGLQVITTNIPAIKEYEELCFISKSDKEFETNLKRVLEKKESKPKEKIDQECKNNTWHERYIAMLSIIKKN